MMRFVLSVLSFLVLAYGVASAQSAFPAVDVVEKVKDSVVSIDANQVAFGSVLSSGGLEYARYQRLLTNRATGFVYTENGYIITDNRSIEDSFILNIILNDGTELEAEVIGTDDDYGVAVLKVNSDEPLTPAKIVRDRYDVGKNIYPYQQGDGVIAIGYSGGFGGTVTYGIIAGVRNFRNRNGILLPSMIQSDVAINSGNEGCPLFSENGEIIAYHDQSTSMENTTFFVPMWVICRVADELIANYETANPDEGFEVWHPWLGIRPFSGSVSPFTGRPREVDPALKMYLNVPDQYWDVGVLIDAVWPEGPAREFGILSHDMIMDVTVLDANENVKVEYQLIESIQDLELLVTTAEKDEVFIFGILRFGSGEISYITREVVVGQHPGAFSVPSSYTLDVYNSQDFF